MKLKIKQIINILSFLLLTNTQFSQAHNPLNGGCKDHCKEPVESITIEKKSNYLNEKNQIKDNYSCLNKSLCRG